jgi:hypothetical protein
MEKDPYTIAREIALARSQARRKWLADHSEDDLDGFGHAQRLMAQIEQAIADGFVPESLTLNEFLSETAGNIQARYHVDVNRLRDVDLPSFPNT